ncbi:UDP-glucose 4-epimerase family protein [Pseudomonas oryziphila]|uniref:SDR family oxidoreductase n=1 Tax=Pseudomonas entomophila TaxID=312306 RepID=A0A3Q8TZ04_9PSED|nr:SDR family oxidoreductase [Pseudomonas oryziphila]AZL67611.1 SDR family oxidoreductase [Pseudomonas oryziphila]
MSYPVLLTGATGFVGAAVLGRLLGDGCRVTAVVRGDCASVDSRAVRYGIDALDEQTEWRNALEGVQVVVHLAARVHVMNDLEVDPLSAFRRVNVEGTLKLARAAAASGVRRFIFLSSIKVNGEGTGQSRPYRADDVPAPVDPYGVSKMEAEQGLRALAEQTGMEVVIIRPVLVYGPGVKANFRSMMGWLQKGVPLPFGAIDNLRSLVALDNLVDLIATCQVHPAAANQTFLVSDDEDLSTTALLTRMARALGKTARLLPLPTRVLEMVAVMLGRRALSQRLCGSLQVDIQKTRSLLQWTPPVTVDEALMRTAQDFQGKTKA